MRTHKDDIECTKTQEHSKECKESNGKNRLDCDLCIESEQKIRQFLGLVVDMNPQDLQAAFRNLDFTSLTMINFCMAFAMQHAIQELYKKEKH